MSRLLAAACAAAALWMAPSLASAQHANDPADGTIFIRLVGDIHALRGDDPRLRREVLLDLTDVPLATGSGFIISPDGWAVTNLHVVTGGTRVVSIRGEHVEVTVDVRRIEVLVPRQVRDPSPPLYSATVTASDADLDIAVLYLSVQDLPYVPLGDSDALAAGTPVRAFGYPFGDALERTLEIGTAGGTQDRAPEVTVSPGAVSSIRRDAGGDVRYVQTTAPINPGNSGGPIVDEDGYVVAVAQLEVQDRAGSGVGFGIPVNLVKQFLRRHGLDQRLTARMLALGGYLDSPAKGIRLQVPAGFTDQSPFRLRVDSAASDPAMTLRIDRLASDQSPAEIEPSVLNDGVLDGVRASTSPRRPPRTDTGRASVDGFARGRDGASGRDLSLVYSIIDLGGEVLVARYIGAVDAVALNRSILQASLASLDARTLLVAKPTWGLPMRWTPVAAGTARTALVLPEGWVVESGGPSRCAGAGEPAWGLAASPPDDFTLQLRAAWRPGATMDIVRAARGCAPRAGGAGEASYVANADWWGTPYQVDGLFVSGAAGTWQLEVVAPTASSARARSVFQAWVAAVVGTP